MKAEVAYTTTLIWLPPISNAFSVVLQSIQDSLNKNARAAAALTTSTQVDRLTLIYIFKHILFVHVSRDKASCLRMNNVYFNDNINDDNTVLIGSDERS